MEMTPRIEQYDEDLRPDVLISRLIDGAADDDDRQHFESLADRDPHLWRELALRQSDAALLNASVEPVLDRLEGICAPAETVPATRRRVLTMPLALSGWAAMIIIGLTWAVVAMVHTNGQQPGGSTVVEVPVFQPYSHMDHLSRYEQAPWYLGAMQPALLEREVMSDGRIAIRFLRRFEEVVFLENEDAENSLIDYETGEIDDDYLKQLREAEDTIADDPAPDPTKYPAGGTADH